jgi:SAM-dependent methyltransferase
VLARWSGWGAVPEVFDDRRAEFAWAREQLAALLSPAELAAARRNTLNAHYTDAALVRQMWRAVRALGFERGRVLEPGCGSGNFLAFAPRGAQLTGIELDPVTAGIAGLLYPGTEVRAESFADSRDGEGSYDLAIGNVPFGNMVLHDRRHNPAGHSIHNHFIVKALHLVRPGGLVAVLTSRFTMDARNPAARREVTSLADLLGAIRLPGGAHQRAAGTSLITDLLVLRRQPCRAPDTAAWEKTRSAELNGVRVPINEYFLDHPDAVLGHMEAIHGAYRADDLVVRPDGDTIAAFSAALDALISSARQRGLAYLPAERHAEASRPVVSEASPSDQPDGYLRARPDGTFTRVVFGAEQPHAVPASQAAELGDLLALRDGARALLAAEAASAEDTPEIAGLRAGLGRRYDRYLAAYGPLNRFSLRRTGRTDPATGEPVLARIRPRQGGFAADPFAPLVYALEQFDPGRPARRQGGRLPRTGHRPARAAARRRHPGRRAGHLPRCPGRAAAGRDRPAARHHRGRRPRPARHARVRRPENRAAGARRRVPVRPGPREAGARRTSGRERPSVHGQRHRTAPGHPARPDARGDRRPARRRLDRHDIHPAVPARDPRRPAAAGRASRRANLGGPR